jgi:hypothetical protein
LGFFRNRVLPLCNYVMATEPLTKAQWESIGWKNRQGISDLRVLFDYQRPTADGRIVIGGSDAPYFAGDAPSSGNYRPALELLTNSLFTTFPQLEGLRIDHAWGGTMGFTIDFTPSVGMTGDHRNIFYGVAYNGEGVAFTQTVGRIICELIAGEESELTRLFVVNHQLPQTAMELLASIGGAAQQPQDKPGWDRLVLEVAVDVLPKIPRDWDTVILDEAQDLSDVDWEFLFELARDKRLWIFHDPLQHFWTERQLPARLNGFFHIQLPQSHRCARGIMALADCYHDPAGLESSRPVIEEALATATVSIVRCPSDTAVPDRIANEIGKLLSAGFRHSDIAIVSVRGQMRARTFGLPRIGAYRLVKADDPAADKEIVDDTSLRFKGLERPAVIITDLNLIHERRAVRMYIAITRALSALRIVATPEAISADPTLRIVRRIKTRLVNLTHTRGAPSGRKSRLRREISPLRSR